MSKQQSTQEPNQQNDDLIIKELNLEDYANEDALNDGAGDVFQSFYARLTELADAVTKSLTTAPTAKFGEWVEETRTQHENMAGNIPVDTDIFINNLQTETDANLASADTEYSRKIMQLEQEQHRWYKRFSGLATNLDKPPEKNAFLLGGFILILLALESIANSRFFAEGSEFGLLGGTLTAITVSMGNVFIPLGLAFVGHRWFHRHDSYRNFGIVLIGLFLLWALGFNHLVAQYRESLVADEGSSTLNYVLLFGLGTAVAGISFWKMWSFLDPFKQARQCMDNLDRTKKEFKDAVCIELTKAQEECAAICSKIKAMDAQIANKFPSVRAEFRRVNSDVIVKTTNVFGTYRRQYCPMKVDPDPLLPVVTPIEFPAGENGMTDPGAQWESHNEQRNRQTHSVGITQAEWAFFYETKTNLESLIKTATDEWLPRLQDILRRINDLITRFSEAITARLLRWNTQVQA